MLELVSVDIERLLNAYEKVGLHLDKRNRSFQDEIVTFAQEHAVCANTLCRGLSCSNIKAMRRGETAVPEMVPQGLAVLLFLKCQVDVQISQALQMFWGIGFDFRFELEAQPQNRGENEPSQYLLRDCVFEIHEASVPAVTDDGEHEIDLRIGFSQLRLVIDAERLRVVGNDYVYGETRKKLVKVEETEKQEWFGMRYLGTEPLRWLLHSHDEVGVLNGRHDAAQLARIEVAPNTSLTAEITVQRDALRVRVAGESRTDRLISEQYRDRMCAALAQRALGVASEYVLLRKPLVHGK